MTSVDATGSELGDLFFEAVVCQYVDDNRRFQRRDWLAADLAESLREPGRRFVLLTAEPGAGKSAFMAQLADAHPEWLRYFIRRDQNRVHADVSSTSLLLRIGYQLAALQPDLFSQEQVRIAVRQRMGEVVDGGDVIGIEVERLIASPFYQNVLEVEQNVRSNRGKVVGLRVDDLVVEPRLLNSEDLLRLALVDPARTLQRTDPDRTIVVLIDAIDEIRYHSTSANILAWLTNAPALPENVRFVLSSRPPDETLELFRSKQRPFLTDLAIAEDDPRVVTDVQQFVERLVGEREVSDALPTKADAAAFIDRAVEKAHGNLGYVDALARGIDQALARGDRQSLRAMLTLTDLPADLKQLYAFFLHQIKVAVSRERVELEDPDTGETYDKPVWSAVHSRILGVLAVALEPLDLALITRLGNIGVGPAEVADGMGQLREFLDVAHGRYRLYHATLAEFLTDATTGADADAADLYQDAQRWHQHIAMHYLGQRGNWRNCDDYGLNNLARHIRLSGRTDQLALLVDNEWMHARVSGGGYLYDGFLDDLSMAWEQADLETRRHIEAGEGTLGLSASLRCALVNGSIIAQSANYPATLVKYLTQLGVWNVERSLSVADRVPDLPQRVAVLVGLLESERLSADQYDKVRRQALAIALGLFSELDRGRALQAVAPYLDGELVQQAWDSVVQIRSKWQEVKAPALAALAPHFSPARQPEALREALAAALSTSGDNQISTALPALVPALKGRLLDEALDQAIDLGYQVERAQALVVMAPHLSRRQRIHALTSVRRMDDPGAQAVALSALAAWSRGADKQRAWQECLQAVAMTRGSARADALQAVAPALDGALAADALRLASEIDDESDRAVAVATLSLKLDEANLATALATAYAMRDQEDRSKLLCALAPRLSGESYSTVMNAALELDDPERWSWALADLAPTLPAELSQWAFDAALGLAYGPKLRILKALAPRMSGELGERALAEVHRVTPPEVRTEVLTDWVPYLDDGVVGQALQVALAIEDLDDRRQVLLALVPRLSREELEQALPAIREIDDASIRITFVLGLRPYVEASLGGEILSQAVEHARRSELPVSAMSMVVGDLEGDALERALSLAEQSDDEYGRMMFLEALAPQLDTPTQERALRVALGIGSDGLRAQALQALARRLDGALLDRLVEAATDMAPGAAGELMIELAPHLDPQVRRALVQEALAFVQGQRFFGGVQTSRLMIATTPFLEDDQVDEVLGMDWRSDQDRADVLAALAPRLSAAQVRDVIAIALAMRTESAKVTVLVGLAPHLSHEQLERLVTAAEDFGHRSKAVTLAAVGPLLPHARGQVVLGEALTAAENIYADYERCKSLVILADVLPEELWPHCLQVASGIKQAKYRAKALAALLPKAPDPDAVQRMARVAIADHIVEDLRDQARPELLRFGIDLALLAPPLVDPTTLDAMARVTLEVGSDWSWL